MTELIDHIATLPLWQGRPRIEPLVGTRDLGQEVYIALTKADTGRGIVAGLAVAAIAIIADRLISAGASKARRRLGLAPAEVD